MGKELREEVQQQLLSDLEKYEVPIDNLSFDSCLEGHCVYYLNSSVENFSGIMVFNIV